MGYEAFNLAFAGGFGGTVAALAIVLLVRYANTFEREADVPAWVWFSIAIPCAGVLLAIYSALA